MLIMSAGQLGHPVLVFIEMESGDSLVHPLLTLQKGAESNT